MNMKKEIAVGSVVLITRGIVKARAVHLSGKELKSDDSVNDYDKEDEKSNME